MNKSIQRVVEFIQSHIADGELVWRKPYICASHANVVSKKAYQGINRLAAALNVDIAAHTGQPINK